MFEAKEITPNSQNISDVMDLFTYGIYAIGSTRNKQSNFMIADWVMQISFNPRLILVSFEKDSYTRESILANKIFNINILSKNNLEAARKFLQPKKVSKIKGRNEDKQDVLLNKLKDIDHSINQQGLPILNNSIGYIECDFFNSQETGDHTLIIGKVKSGTILNYDDPLSSIDTGWHYSG